MAVQTGLKAHMSVGNPTALADERNIIQTVVEWVEAQDYATARTRLVDESRHRSAQHSMYLLGRNTPDMDTLVADIYRCQESSGAIAMSRMARLKSTARGKATEMSVS